MARRKNTRTSARPDLREAVAQPLRLLCDRLNGLEIGGYRLPYRTALAALERGDTIEISGWQITHVLPSAERDARYLLHPDNTLTKVSNE